MATATPPSPAPFAHHSFVPNPSSNRRNPHSLSRPETPASLASMHSHSTSGSSPGGLLDPPAGVSYVEFVKQWQDVHVARWLTDNRCGQYSDAFRLNDIRGDIILELDMDTLKEMGVTSVGDRTRIRSAIKELRRLCTGSGPSTTSTQSGPRLMLNGNPNDLKAGNGKTSGEGLDGFPSGTRGARSRPPPLRIEDVREKDLPQIQRLDSARLVTPRTQTSNQRLPPGPAATKGVGLHSQGSLASKSAPRLTVPAASTTTTQRTRTPTSESPFPPFFTNEPLPPAPSPISPWAAASTERGLPRNPAPGNLGGGSFAPRATSPLPPGVRGRAFNAAATTSHQRQGSSGASKSSSKSSGSISGHPYSSPNASLAPVAIGNHILSPVNESFIPMAGSPPTNYSVGRGPFSKSNTAQGGQDEVRRRLIKFHLGESNSRTLDIRDLEDAQDLLERALKKFAVQMYEHQPEMDGTLSVGGWGVFVGTDPDGMCKFIVSRLQGLTWLS